MDCSVVIKMAGIRKAQIETQWIRDISERKFKSTIIGFVMEDGGWKILSLY
jgi:hypothetical protein